jgi:N-acetylglucosamine-6-phosphate deacetylase
MPRTLFENAVLCLREGLRECGWLLVEGERIAALGLGAAPDDGAGAERIDVAGRVLAAGLIDLHVHGALGYDTMDATPVALEHMARFYAQHGVTGFLATTMAAPQEAVLAALTNVAQVMCAGTHGAAVLGAHVEGPYIDVERRGCQDPAQVRRANPAEYERLFATGVVKLITLAPEFPESQALIRYAIQQGAAVAAGHTRASYDEMCRAVGLGVSQVTHLFNGMEPLHHRAPGVVGAALALEALRCQLIADNIHIHPAVLKLAVRAKGLDAIILVTDAMRGAGMPDGTYDLGGLAVNVRAGAARLADGTLAGSTLTLERAVRNIMAAADLSLADALRLATSVPACALGLQAHKGVIAAGYDADLVMLDEELNVHLTMVGGEVVFSGELKREG